MQVYACLVRSKARNMCLMQLIPRYVYIGLPIHGTILLHLCTGSISASYHKHAVKHVVTVQKIARQQEALHHHASTGSRWTMCRSREGLLCAAQEWRKGSYWNKEWVDQVWEEARSVPAVHTVSYPLSRNRHTNIKPYKLVLAI